MHTVDLLYYECNGRGSRGVNSSRKSPLLCTGLRDNLRLIIRSTHDTRKIEGIMATEGRTLDPFCVFYQGSSECLTKGCLLNIHSDDLFFSTYITLSPYSSVVTDLNANVYTSYFIYDYNMVAISPREICAFCDHAFLSRSIGHH